MERTPHRDRQGRSEAPAPSLPPALLVGSSALPQWGGGLLYHFSGCSRAPCLSLPMSHSSSFLRRRARPCPPHPRLSPGARLFAWQWASFKAHGQQHPQCSLARSLRTGARSPTYAESRCWGHRSVGDIAAAELAPSLVGVRGTFGRRSKKRPEAVCSRSFGPLFLVIRFGDLRSHVLGSGHRHPFLGTLEGFEHEERVAGWVPVSPRAARGGGRGGGAAGPARGQARRSGRGGQSRGRPGHRPLLWAQERSAVRLWSEAATRTSF